MYFLYNILIFISGFFLIPYYAIRAIVNLRYRAGIKERFGFIQVPSKKKKRIVVHASSVGEVNIAYPIIKELKEWFKECEIFLTVMTPEGYALAKEKLNDEVRVYYFCLDFKSSVNRFLRRLVPDAVLILETEIWPNFLRILKNRDVTIGIINGRISEKSYKNYKRFKGFIRKVLRNVDFFLMQHEEYKKRVDDLIGVGYNVKVTNNIKFDIDDTFFNVDQSLLEKVNGLSYIVAASTHEGEEKSIIRIFQEIRAEFPGIKLIIAPRHIQRCQSVELLIQDSGLSCVKRSQLDEGFSAEGHDVILVDTIGDLVTLFKDAKLAFVGGSLVDVGGHNIIEPAYFSVPIIFGKYMQNFSEAKDLILKERGGVSVKDETELKKKLVYYLKNEEERILMGKRAKQALEACRGALNATMDEIKKRVEL